MKKQSLVSLLLLLTSMILALDLPSNTWEPLSLNFPLPTNVTNPEWWPTDGYCTAIYDDSTHQVIWRSGVGEKNGTGCFLYPGYYSNTFLTWGGTEDTVKTIGLSNWGGGSYNGGCLLPAFATDTTPSPRHTYDGLTYCRSNHSIYMMLGANWKITLGSSDSEAVQMLRTDDESTWRFSLTEKKWHRIPGSVRQFWPSEYTVSAFETHLRYWPAGNKLLFTDGYGRRHAEYDIATETWTNIQTIKPSLTSPYLLYEARSCWDTKRGLWVFQSDTATCAYDPAKREYSKIPGPGISAHTIAYDSRRDVYVVVGNNSQTTRYFSWKDSLWHTPAVAVSIPFGTSYLVYDSLNDQHLLVYQHSAYRFHLDTEIVVSVSENEIHPSSTLTISAQPNPFNPTTKILVEGSHGTTKVISIFDMQGHALLKRSLVSNTFLWNASRYPAGMYLVRVEQLGHSVQKKIVLTK